MQGRVGEGTQHLGEAHHSPQPSATSFPSLGELMAVGRQDRLSPALSSYPFLPATTTGTAPPFLAPAHPTTPQGARLTWRSWPRLS